MPALPDERTNVAWTTSLRGDGPECAAAVHDLETYLQRVLRGLVGSRLGDEAVEELVQESIVRIVQSLASFRGDSAFRTWATGIATRVAFTELRRRKVRERHHASFEETVRDAADLACPRTPSPDDALANEQITQALHAAIASALTERQRIAILAELRGIPTIEIAERLDTNQNALYKLTHDARRKLRSALLQAGITAEFLRQEASEAAR